MRAVSGLALMLSVACGRWGYDALPDHDAGSGGGDGATGDDGAAPMIDAAPIVCEPPDCTEVSIPVGTDDDDGAIHEGALFTGGVSGGHIEMGRIAGDTAWGYFRFALPVAIPSGSVIADARLTTHTDPADGWDEANHQLLILAEDTADAPVITSFEERPDGTVPGFVRFPIATTVPWNASGLPWPSNVELDTPNLAPLLQSLVDSYGGLAAGAHVQLWIRGDGFSVDAVAVTADSSHPIVIPPTLSIAFVPP